MLQIAESRRRYQAINTPVDILTPDSLLDLVKSGVESNTRSRVVFCNVSTVVACRQDSALDEAVRSAEVVSPDGMPLVWLARLQGERDAQRVDGPTFMKTAMQRGVEWGWRHYLFGGSPEVLDQLAQNLTREIPGLQIVGQESPPFGDVHEDHHAAAIERMNAAEPHFVWVGLGMPKQELWMSRYQASIAAPILLGVGAAFDFHAGAKKRAPDWMRKNGLEWSHRLFSEPRRLWKRYLFGNSLFAYFVAHDALHAAIGRVSGRR